MKKPQDHLWRLIQALNPAEKRYFRRHFAPDDGQLIRLYEAINKLPAYDEALLREKLACTPALFKVLKAQLFDLLLLSLRAFNDKTTITAKLSSALLEVDLLVDKHLYDIALPKLQRAKELCLHYEEYAFLYEIIEREYLLTRLYSESYQLSIAEYWADWQLIVDQLSTHLHFQFEGQRLVEAGRHVSPDLHTTLADKEEALELAEPPKLGFRTRISWLTTRQLLASIKGDLVQSDLLKKEVVELFEQSPHFIDSYTVAYVGAMRNYANTLSRLNQIADLELLIQKIKDVIKRHPVYEPQLIHFYFALFLLYYEQQNWKLVCEGWQKKMAPLVQKHQLQAGRVTGLSLVLTAMAHINRGEYTPALKVLVGFEAAATKVEPAGRMMAILLTCIIYWETEEQDILNTKLESIRRRKTEQANLQASGLFAIHLQLLEQLLRQPFEATRLAAQILLELPNYYEDVFFSIYSELGLERWLQALATRRKIVDVLRERPSA